MNNDIEKIIKIGIGVIALLVVVSLAKLTPKNETITLDDYTPDITTESTATQNTTTEYATGTLHNTDVYTTEDVQENNLIVPEGREDEFFADEITIPRNITVGADGVAAVIEPFSLNSPYDEISGIEATEQKKEDLRNAGVNLLDIYENEDMSWTLKFDEENLEKRYIDVEQMLNYQSQEAYSKVSLSKNLKNIILYIRDDSTLFGFGMDILRMKWCITAAQVYSGVPYDEWTIHLDVVYEETGELMYEFDFSEEDYEYNITEEEWNQKLEEMKENASATATDASVTDATY